MHRDIIVKNIWGDLMATTKRPFTLRVQDENFEKIKIIAEKEKRSVSMQIEHLIEQCIMEYEKEHGPIQIN